MIYTILAIFVGGGLGSVCRFGIGQWVLRLTDARFPWGTLAVNVIACLILGLIWLLIGKDTNRQPGWVAFGIIGFCGGFSTFSTFGFETLQLMRDGMYLYAGLNVFLSVVTCLIVLNLFVRSY